MRILKRHPLLKPATDFVIDSPTPSNISYWWNIGSLLGLSLVIQIITGVTLAMHYNPNVLEAFNSVEHIMRDVNNEWLIRYLHANTASAFFFLVYLHMSRGLSLHSTIYNNGNPFTFIGGPLFTRLDLLTYLNIAIQNPPKPHSFVSLPLQSSLAQVAIMIAHDLWEFATTIDGNIEQGKQAVEEVRDLIGLDRTININGINAADWADSTSDVLDQTKTLVVSNLAYVENTNWIMTNMHRSGTDLTPESLARFAETLAQKEQILQASYLRMKTAVELILNARR